MSITFKKSTLEDIETLLLLQKAAFQEDLEKYEDFESNPACETDEKLAENIRNITTLPF
ncbi:hypothetical protein ACINKY_19285 [Paenibacillus illinoisensis]|uniref:Uncharacterized protein n=1 Tax=Paenibacillus illinoisensis TaxID=59845 RepID=A0ABW8HZJ3_9BACL